MFCNKCGSPIDDGSLFCTECGAPIEDGEAAADNTQPQQEGDFAPPYDPYGAYPAQPEKKRMSKNAKGFMWGGIGLAALAIAAVLIFVVFAGGGLGLLSGNTVQTRFVNEAALVVAESVSEFDMGTSAATTMDKPFDMDMSMSVKGYMTDMDMTIAAAYDDKTLGVLINSADIGKIRALLLEDTLYTEMFGMVSGVRFKTDADLSKDMTLNERIKALAGGDLEEVDNKLLAEAFVNSFDKKCFSKNSGSFTLRLTPEDIQDALKAFGDKLKEDKALQDEMDKIMKNSGSADTDILESLKQAEAALDYDDFTLTITVVRGGGKPSKIVFNYDDGDQLSEITFSTEKQNNGRLISLSSDTGDIYSDFRFTMLVSKVKGGFELSGSIISGTETSINYDGSFATSGTKATGELNFKGAEDYENLSFRFEQVLTLGMPKTPVAEDARFAIDTKNATVQDMEASFSPFGVLGGNSMLP